MKDIAAELALLETLHRRWLECDMDGISEKERKLLGEVLLAAIKRRQLVLTPTGQFKY